jgi:hypothetical protein
MKYLKIFFGGLLFFISLNCYSQSPVNVFETFESGVIPANWVMNGFFIDNTLNHTPGGSFSARSSQGAPPQNNYLRSTKFSVLAGEKIELVFFALRTGGGQNPWASVRIKGTNFDHSFDTVVISNTTWQSYRFDIDPIPANDSVYIFFYCNTNPGSQRAIFDDISIVKSVILPGVPSQPSALLAVASGPDAIGLNWIDNSTNEINFIIERRVEGSPLWSAIDSVSQDVTSYSDSFLNPNTVYHYRVYAKNLIGNSSYSNEAYDTTFTITNLTHDPSVPQMFRLANNYPNPFNPTTKIKFDIPASNKSSNVRLTVFDASGREVSTLINSQIAPGSYEFQFSANNLTSGVYFYRLSTDNFVDTKKMILLK